MMIINTKQMTQRKTTAEQISFRLKLYQLRSELLKKGILQPVKNMVEEGLIADSKQNHNFLSGRILNQEFLDALSNYNDLTNESF